MKIELEPFTKTVPESNATNVNFTWTNNIPSLGSTNRDVTPNGIFLPPCLLDEVKLHALGKKTKHFFDGGANGSAFPSNFKFFMIICLFLSSTSSSVFFFALSWFHLWWGMLLLHLVMSIPAECYQKKAFCNLAVSSAKISFAVFNSFIVSCYYNRDIFSSSRRVSFLTCSFIDPIAFSFVLSSFPPPLRLALRFNWLN